MKLLAIGLLSLVAFQEKPAQQEPSKTSSDSKIVAPEDAPPIPPKPNPVGAVAVINVEAATTNSSQIVFENGAFYTKVGGINIPLVGGGAGGCFGKTESKTPEILKDTEIKIKDEKEKPEKPKQQ